MNFTPDSIFIAAFNGDMMRMGKRESAFYDDARFGKRG